MISPQRGTRLVYKYILFESVYILQYSYDKITVVRQIENSPSTKRKRERSRNTWFRKLETEPTGDGYRRLNQLGIPKPCPVGRSRGWPTLRDVMKRRKTTKP